MGARRNSLVARGTLAPCAPEIVVAGNVHKFRQHDDLRAFLLGTGDRVLVEASPLDRIWGIGLREDDPRAEDPPSGADLTCWASLSVMFATFWLTRPHKLRQ